jgi:hypothetical protein
LGLLIIATVLVSGCGRQSPEVGFAPVQESGQIQDDPAPQDPIAQQEPSSPQEPSAPQEVEIDLSRSDSQGAVEVVVLPLNLLDTSKESINFEIQMNTHSVDLSMDLALLAVLETDQGKFLPAISWSGGTGHHVSGILTFSTKALSGEDALADASQITLIIRDLDAPSRTFHWELGSPQ